jgi:hypothetical protein
MKFSRILHSSAFFLIAGQCAFAQSQNPEDTSSIGLVQRDVWTNISGDLSQLLRTQSFPNSPNQSSFVASSLNFSSIGDNYGQRIRGSIVPPLTGNWRFWITGDDSAELWLSPSWKASEKRRIANLTSWLNPNAFDVTPSQKSNAIPLSANTPYYFEILHKEGGGADHVSVAWAYESENFALASNGATASQSNTGWGGVASRAIDGNTNGSWNANTTTHTAGEPNPWLAVDFGQDRAINRVKLWNRADGLQSRLSNFRISVLDAAGAEIAGENFYPAGSGNVGTALVWSLPSSIVARQIRISLLGVNNRGDNYLSLAELEAYEEIHSETQRQIIPVIALRKQTLESGDTDGNGLPDAWEIAMGLRNANGTGTRPSISEYSDDDGDSITNLEEWRLGLDPRVPNSAAGLFLFERWDGIFKYSADDLVIHPSFYGPANSRYFADPNAGKFSQLYFGARMRGYIEPKVTGDYTFWLSARNGAELYLSTALAKGKYAKRVIASLDPKTGAGHGIASNESNLWDRFSTQRSKTLRLVAGQRYYTEVLLQNGHGGSAHASIAWAYNGGPRTILPADVAFSYVKTSDDADDDFLPDAWESQYGLSITDNGAIDMQRQGERGDYDGDGLTNREEYLLGIDPSNSDTDGDGISDFDEIAGLGTDALTANAITDTLLTEIALGSHVSSSTAWTMTSGGLIADSFRGEATWNFTVPTAGNWLLRLDLELMGATYGNEEVPIVIKVDGKIVVRKQVRFGTGKRGLLQALSPWLLAGNHQVSVLVDNSLARRAVRLVSLKILAPANAAATLAKGNRILSHPVASRTSPAFLEGYARDPGTVTLNGTPAQIGTGSGHWFANVPLSNLPGAQSYIIMYEQGWQTSGTLTWQATNAMDAETLTIRRGDALRVGAWASDPAMPSTLTLSSGGNIQLTGEGTSILTFPTAGVFTVTGTLGSGEVATLTVRVIAPPGFTGQTMDALDNFARTLSVSAVPEVTFEVAEDLARLSVSRTTTTASLAIAPLSPEEMGVAARLFPGGPILAVQRVNVIGVSDALQNDLTTSSLSTIPGYKLLQSPLTVLNLPTGARVDVSIFRAGVMFTNGTTFRSIRLADLVNGSVSLQFLFPLGMPGGYCHTVNVYDRNGVFLGSR